MTRRTILSCQKKVATKISPGYNCDFLGDREDSGSEAALPDSSHGDLEPRRKKRSQHHQVGGG